MTTEFDELQNSEIPTIEQTIKTFSVAADMFLAGKNLAIERLNTPPFIPTVLELADHVSTEVPELSALTESQRSFLAVDGLMKTYNLLSKRAEYQEKYYRYPDIVASNLARAIWENSDHVLRFDPNRINFKWSLFSMAMVLPEKEFKEAVKYQYNKVDPTILGFVGFLTGELGSVPIILKGRGGKKTMWHEDIHVYRENMKISFPFQLNMGKVVRIPGVLRAAKQEGIRKEDLQINEMVFERLLSDAKLLNREELATSLWAGEMPVIGVIDNPGQDQDLSFISVNLLNCIYAEATNLTDRQKLEKHFEILSKINLVGLERARMFAAAKQGMKQYKGKGNPWGWAAARATVIPPEFSPRLFEAIILGRGVELEENPKIDKGSMLASILITHVRRSVLPDAFGQGGMVHQQFIEAFLKNLYVLVNNRSLYSAILDSYKFEDTDLKNAKNSLIKFAKASVPNGIKSQIERDLSSKIFFC